MNPSSTIDDYHSTHHPFLALAHCFGLVHCLGLYLVLSHSLVLSPFHPLHFYLPERQKGIFVVLVLVVVAVVVVVVAVALVHVVVIVVAVALVVVVTVLVVAHVVVVVLGRNEGWVLSGGHFGTMGATGALTRSR